MRFENQQSGNYSTPQQRWLSGVLLVVVLVSCQVHLVLFQLSSWVWMLAEYSQETESAAEAVEMTFDGKHKCSGCLAVEAMQEDGMRDQDQGITSRSSLLLFPLMLPRVLEWFLMRVKGSGRMLDFLTIVPDAVIIPKEIPPPRT